LIERHEQLLALPEGLMCGDVRRERGQKKKKQKNRKDRKNRKKK